MANEWVDIIPASNAKRSSYYQNYSPDVALTRAGRVTIGEMVYSELPWFYKWRIRVQFAEGQPERLLLSPGSSEFPAYMYINKTRFKRVNINVRDHIEEHFPHKVKFMKKIKRPLALKYSIADDRRSMMVHLDPFLRTRKQHDEGEECPS